MKAPDHPILPRAWEYDVVGVNWQLAPDDSDESFLDLTVERGPDRRTLRFWSPQNVSMAQPLTTHGMIIVDVRQRGLDRIAVQVDDFEASPGGIRFWAREVEQLAEKA